MTEEEVLAEDAACQCWKCYLQRAGANPEILGIAVFRTCPLCRNKRCPKNKDHRFRCTGSNEPGQMGELETETERDAMTTNDKKPLDLWGPIECLIGESHPAAMLQRQSDRITERTNGLLYGYVRASSASPVMGTILDFQLQVRTTGHHLLELAVLTITVDGQSRTIEAQSHVDDTYNTVTLRGPDEFQKWMKSVLRNKKLLERVSNLWGTAKALQKGKETR